MYLTFGDLQDQIIHFDRDDSPAKHSLVMSLINQYYLEIAMMFMSRHRRKTISLFPSAEVTGGTASIVLGSRSVVLSSATPGAQYQYGMFTPAGAQRGYLVTAISGGTLTLEDPIEEATASGATYTLRKQYFLLPDDFESWDLAVETQTPGVIFVQSREIAELVYKQNKNTGSPIIVSDAGKNRFATYNSGTAYVDQGATTVNISGGTPNEARDYNRMLMFRNRPHPFLVTAVGASSYTIDRPYLWDTIPSPGTAYDVDPIGTAQLVEFWPIPLDHSIRLTYYAKPRPLLYDHEIPSLLPEDAHRLIVQGVLEELGIREPGGLEVMLRKQVGRDRLDRPASIRLKSFAQQDVRPSNLPPNFPPFSFLG